MSGTVPDWVVAAARAHPDVEAVVDARFRWTYADLEAVSRGLAGAMLSAGIGEGSRVATLLADDAAAVALVHALRRLGAVQVPLNRRAAAAELGAQLGQAEADAMVHDPGRAGLAVSSIVHRPAVPLFRVAALLARAMRPRAMGDVPHPAALRDEVELGAIATMVFTSGTSGRPKAALLTHGNHVASADAWAAFLAPGPDDRWCACLPLYHVAGMAMIHRASRWGIPLEVHERFDPPTIDAAIDRGASLVSLVPPMLERLLDARAGRRFPSTLRAVLLGGGPLPAGLVTRSVEAGIPVVPSYGLTETASGVVALASREASARPGSAGRPLPGAEVRIGTPDGPAPAGELGEILVRGPMVFAGYEVLPPERRGAGPAIDEGAPRDSALVPQAKADGRAGGIATVSGAHESDTSRTGQWDPGGWFRTGDIGSLDADGYLTVADRRDDILVSGGENVYPAEVEATLLLHPSVADAVVVGIPDDRWGTVPVALVVLHPGADADDGVLAAHCAVRLARYKVPVAFHRVPVIPRSDGGKLLRREARTMVPGLPRP